jgi:YgiT-type zinc finger domain-containing protein
MPAAWVVSMQCEFCRGETISKQVSKDYQLNGRLYRVENVPAEVCPECGERYYHAGTLDASDRLLSGEHTIKDRIEVEVVSL